MTKQEQQFINEKVLSVMRESDEEYDSMHWQHAWKRLYNCTAEYAETEHYIFLRSYNTIIAVYSKIDRNVYDYLRYVYGYTATSCQHVHKFVRKCSEFRIGYPDLFSYKPI